MGKLIEFSFLEIIKLWVYQNVRSFKLGFKIIYKFDKFESFGGLQIKFNNSLWLFFIFSNSNIDNIFVGVVYFCCVLKQLDFGFFESVLFKKGVNVVLNSVVIMFFLDINVGLSCNNSRRFLQEGFCDIELVIDYVCGFIIIDEL